MKLSNYAKNYVKIIKKNKSPNRYYTGLLSYQYKTFIINLKKKNFIYKTINHLKNGKIIVLKSSCSKQLCKKIIKDLDDFSFKTSEISYKMVDGIKNGYYISKSSGGNSYSTFDKSFYFFSWNKDTTKLYDKIIKIYKPLKILNGLDENEITNYKPSDGVVERIHVIHYPNKGGHISKHIDPIKFAIANFGIYLTEFNKDYESGGFFVENSKKEKVKIDEKIRTGDCVIFFPGLKHGVDPIFVNKKKLTTSSGRWFCNINIVESHVSKNRERSTGIK